MIRRATGDDLGRVVELATEFHAAGVWSDVPIDREAFTAFTANLIRDGAVFLADHGVIAGMVSPFYFNPAFKLGLELFWYAKTGGGELRRAFEDWCLSEGAATAMQCSAMADEHLPAVTRIYHRAGYEPVETAFVKRF